MDDFETQVKKLEEASKLNDKCRQLWCEIVAKAGMYKTTILQMDTVADMQDYITLMKRKNALIKSISTKILILSSEYKQVKNVPLVNRQIKRNKNGEITELVHEYEEYIDCIYKKKKEKMYV